MAQAIQAVHAVLFLLLAAGGLYVLACGLTGRRGRILTLAVVGCGVELAVLALNGWVCPLTRLAERYGARSGSVADLFLPAWTLPYIFPAFGAAYGLGLLLLILWRPKRR